MWWVGMCLAVLGTTWANYIEPKGPKLSFLRLRAVRKPPDKQIKWERFYFEYAEME